LAKVIAGVRFVDGVENREDASAREARLLDEGLQQHRAVRVARVPVTRQSSADEGEDTRGKVTTLNPRQDQKSRIVDDEVQVARTLFVRPADELVSPLGFSRRLRRRTAGR
jgi:hypothetical protein